MRPTIFARAHSSMGQDQSERVPVAAATRATSSGIFLPTQRVSPYQVAGSCKELKVFPDFFTADHSATFLPGHRVANSWPSSRLSPFSFGPCLRDAVPSYRTLFATSITRSFPSRGWLAYPWTARAPELAYSAVFARYLSLPSAVIGGPWSSL